MPRDGRFRLADCSLHTGEGKRGNGTAWVFRIRVVARLNALVIQLQTCTSCYWCIVHSV